MAGVAAFGAVFAAAAFLATGAAFLAGAFAGATFLAATGFFAGAAFFATTGFFAAGFFAGAAFFAAGLATGFFAADFFGAADFGAAFFAAALAAGFLVALAAFFAGFFAATSGVSSVPSNGTAGHLQGAEAACESPTARVGVPTEKSNAPFVSPCSATLFLESALLYPAPATAATAFRLRFSALEYTAKRSQLMRRMHVRQ